MIFRGVVEHKINEYVFKVRIPLLDRITESHVNTKTNSLNDAVLCSLPGCEIELKVGDIVFVSKDDCEEDWTIIGYLYRLDSKDQRRIVRWAVQNLDVETTTKLSVDTTIGKVAPNEISHLSGVNDNIQNQFNVLYSSCKALSSRCNKLESDAVKINDQLDVHSEEIQRVKEDIQQLKIEIDRNTEAINNISTVVSYLVDKLYTALDLGG